MLSFAEPGSSQGVSRVGDVASAVMFSDGRVGIIARKGDAFIRVDWDPQVYPGAAADVGGRLANALTAGMSQSARCDHRAKLLPARASYWVQRHSAYRPNPRRVT